MRAKSSTSTAERAQIVSEDSLSEAFQAKETWAFDEAYRRYGALLYSVARQVLSQEEDAQDAVHDALTRVWRSPCSYTKARGTVRSFLTVCVRNEAITRFRSNRRRDRTISRLIEEPIDHDEVRLVDFVENNRLRRALSTLPSVHRHAIELAYFEQKTHSEIARELKQPLGTVKSRISNGLRKLGTELGREIAFRAFSHVGGYN